MTKIKKQIEFTTQEDIGNTTPLTYKSYITGLSGQPYKHFIMIAELIDNSISSFENKFSDEWSDILEIDINIDFRGQIVKSSKDDLDFSYVDKSFIEVKDNGFGMENEYNDPIDLVLKKSLILDNPNQRQSDKNVFGRGMKQCAYFFGQDLSVETSNGKQKFIAQQLFTKEDISLVTPYRIFPIEVENPNPRGTRILIENIYDDRIFSANTFDEIVNSLEWRYINYLQKDNKKMSIRFSFFDNKGDKREGEFQPEKEVKLVIDESIKTRLLVNGIKSFEEKIDSWYEPILKSATKEDLDPVILAKSYNNLKQIFLTALAGDSTPEFKSVVKLKLEHNQTGEIVNVPFEFWALPEKRKKKTNKKNKEKTVDILDKDAGIRFFEGDRAITHISIKDKEVGPWMDWVVKPDASWRTDKRFCGMMDLKLIGAKPTVDKSKFKLKDETLTKIQKYVWTVYRAYWIFMRNIMKQEAVSKDPEEVLLSADEIIKSTEENLVTDKVKFNPEKSNIDEREYNFEYNSSDKLWNIDIKIDYMKNPSHIMHPIIDKLDSNNFRVIVYRSHEFWSIIRTAAKDNENQFLLDIVMPIVHLIIKSSIKMSNPSLEIEKINEEAKDYTAKITSGDDAFVK